LGYDRIRFVGSIFVGDTVTVTYTISEIDEENLRTRADIEVVSQRIEVCTADQHILKFLA
jgi:3-hydroxybutyryl-CoA dehydratase